MNGQHGTNNICESWNGSLKHLVGHAHTTVWKLISKMGEELQELGED